MLASSGQWLLKRSRNAWVAAGLLAPFPLIGWLSAVIVALVTLRRGLREGALVLLAASLPFVVWLFTHDDTSFYLILKCMSLLMVWVLAALLRQTHSWYLVLITTTVVSLLSVIGTHLVLGDTQQFWMQQMLLILQNLLAQAQAQELDVVVIALNFYKNLLVEHQALPFVASIATGLFVVNAALGVLLQLCVARYWQSELFHPGGFQKEIYRLRLPMRDSFALAVCAIGALTQLALFADLLPVMILPFLFVAVCLVQQYFIQKRWSQFAFYCFCMGLAIFVPYSLVVLVGLSVFDSVVDLRRHFNDNKVMR